MVKLILQFFVVMGLISISLHLSAFAAGSSFLPDDPSAVKIYTSHQIPGAEANISGKNGFDILKDAILGGLQYVKILTVVVGILFMTIMGYTLVTNGSSEEDVTKAKKGMIFTIIAFVMISMSQNIAKIFDMTDGSVLGSPQEILNRVHIFDKQTEIFVTFVKYVIGTYAVVQIVRHGAKMVTAGGNDEEMGKRKKAIMFNVAGLLLIYLGDIAINKVFYKVDKTVYSGITGVHPYADAKAGVDQIVGITNLIVTFVGPVGVLMLIVGAIMYATAGGQDEQLQKAKRILVTAGIGLVIIFGAFAIVSTVLAGKLQSIGSITP
ncbi:MAG: pilin [Candidatus Peregrinibacteria bacterium]|nr:pilin [Candidatus Peregrinibacteria bacterium]